MKTLFFLFFSLLASMSLHAQTTAARSFHLNELQIKMGDYRRRAIEQVIVTGDGSSAGDQKIIDTLRIMAQSRLYDKDGKKSWKKFNQVFKVLTISNATFSQIPAELGDFKHLFEVVFVNCPNINLQSINDQIKALKTDEKLKHKFTEDIVSLSFIDSSLPAQMSFNLDLELLGELREIRLVNIRNLDRHCVAFLEQLCKNYPHLKWLSLEKCGLRDENFAKGIKNFNSLKTVSLRNNFLTKIPQINASLNSLDVSNNLIDRFPAPTDSINLSKLNFLLTDCNLMDYKELTRIYKDPLFLKKSLFAYACNCESPVQNQTLADSFDQHRVAVYLSYAKRYVNNFTPDQPDCKPCQEYRREVLRQRLDQAQFEDEQSHSGYRLDYFPATDKVVKTPLPTGQADVMIVRKIERVERVTIGNTGWLFTLNVEKSESPEMTLQNLKLFIPDEKGVSGRMQMK